MRLALDHWLRRLHEVGSARRRLLIHASLTLTAASAAVALLPFRRAIALGAVPLRGGATQDSPADYVWAVEAASRRIPWRTMCIEKGLAVQRMLRRGGIDALLHYGARLDPKSHKLEAHVWVTVAGSAVIGGEEAVDYREIASFP
jgi:Transglutaminase-like superfamily